MSGIYDSVISSFFEPHCHHTASNHHIFSKLMHHFYLEYPSSPWASASSTTTLPLALVTAKCCTDLTLWYTHNQHLFLQCHATIFVHASSGKTDQMGYLSPHIHIESDSNVSLCPGFCLKDYLWHREPFGKKSDGSLVSSVFLCNNRQ